MENSLEKVTCDEWKVQIEKNLYKKIGNLIFILNQGKPTNSEIYPLVSSILKSAFIDSLMLDKVKESPKEFIYYKDNQGRLDLKYKNSKESFSIPGYF